MTWEELTKVKISQIISSGSSEMLSLVKQC